ncbi:hypothetical protein BKA70DRAFT_411750 [Coprinopsis sp. MPI-PUGE-AT-0042]|nr:hypothetical protein BKA70DRAFT_411750 [Coprinopsis sp. MPI-PUGE-AT-0042]
MRALQLLYVMVSGCWMVAGQLQLLGNDSPTGAGLAHSAAQYNASPWRTSFEIWKLAVCHGPRDCLWPVTAVGLHHLQPLYAWFAVSTCVHNCLMTIKECWPLPKRHVTGSDLGSDLTLGSVPSITYLPFAATGDSIAFRKHALGCPASSRSTSLFCHLTQHPKQRSSSNDGNPRWELPDSRTLAHRPQFHGHQDPVVSLACGNLTSSIPPRISGSFNQPFLSQLVKSLPFNSHLHLDIWKSSRESALVATRKRSTTSTFYGSSSAAFDRGVLLATFSNHLV